MLMGLLQVMPRESPLLKLQVRSLWPTYRCPSTTCWLLQAPHETISPC